VPEGGGAEESVAKDTKGRRALGRGLDALFTPKPAAADAKYGAGAVFTCPIERIKPRSDQPRKHFDTGALDDLAATIREHGIIQPLVVRRVGDDAFQLIAGERRWRAAQRAGLKDVPVVVKDVTPEKAFELALIENLQREDLNPIEVAEAYQRLLDDHHSTQEDLARVVGKNRTTVTNSLRLLKLPAKVRAMIQVGTLSEGHGRALLGAPDVESMVAVAEKAIRGRLSVRKIESLIRQAKRDPKAAKGAEPKTPAVRDLEIRLTRRLSARVTVEHRGPGGKLVVSYGNLDELDRIIESLDA
jgi:ParB family chromosome partitioning protein